MGKFVTYVMAAAVGLVFAIAIGLPSLLTLSTPQSPEPSTEDPGAMIVMADPPNSPLDSPSDASSATLPDDAPPPADNQTLLLADVGSGSVTAVINERAVGALEAGRVYDLGPYVRPGQNSIRLRWSAPVRADIRVRHSTTAGITRDAGQAFLTPAGTQSPGEQTLTFYL